MEQARMLEALDTELLYREIGRLAADDNGSSSSDDEMFVPSSELLESMENIGTSRQWLKDLLLELSSDSDSEDNIDFDLYLHQTCQMHRNQLKDDSSLSRFMYYSSDLVTGDNKWASSCEAVVKKEQMKKQDQRKLRKIKSLKSTTGAQTDGEKYDRRKVGVPTFTDQSSAIESVSDTYPGHYSVHKKNKGRSFDANAMRKKLWKIITKKDIPKAYRQRYQNRSTKLALLKKAAKDSVKKVRSKALESRQRSKREAIVSGARRMTREAQLFWKKYSKVEKTQRRKAEKQALVQRKLDDEIREAHRQRRKLNFLITQTELYAHFMNGKLKAEKIKGEMDEEEHRILQQLDQDREQSSVFKIFGETEDDFSKENVLSNAHSAFLQHQTKMDMFSPGACQDTVDYSSLPQPEMLNGKLTGYQLEGVNWLLGLYMHGLNGILADDMGLGKTVQTIAFFAHLAERVKIWGPFLVVAPASTLNNWHQELSRFLPSFKVLPYWGNINERKILRMFWNQKADVMHDSSAPFHVLVTSYQLVVSDVRYFQRIQWQYMVLDEAHALKSTSSVRWKTLLDFNCRNRLLLTGTPIQNTMAELWALLHFIMPTLFDSHGEFNEWFSKDIEFHAENKSNIDEKHLSRLHMILKPFMLRRLKSEVEHELTDKIEIRVLCQLAPRQRALYDALQKNITMEDLLQSHNVSSSSSNNSNVLMNLVMQFRKMCNHPDLFQSHDVYSSLHFCLPTHLLPKLIYHSFLNRPFCQGRSTKLYSDYCIHSRDFTHKSILNDEAFSFLPLIGMTANEYWNLFTEKDDFRKEYTRSSNAQLQRAVLSQVWSKPSLHDGTFQRHHLMVHQVDHASDVIDTRTVTSIIIPNIHDTLAYNTSTSNCLSNLFFWHSSSHFYSHLRCSVTYLKCPDASHAATTPAPKPPTDSTDKTINLETQSLDEMFQRRLVTSHLQCHPTSMPKLFKNIYMPKVYSTFPLFYCNDRHAEHKKQTSRRDDKTQNYLHFSPITIPDRERLVSDSGKLRAIDMLLKRLKEGQHRVLIYSQMTKMIDILEEYMMMRRHKYVRLDGSSRISSRRDTVAGFQSSDDIFVFLLSTRAGGLGINLTAADTVIFYDSDWNPTVDQQAMDRAHRLGQTKQVTVYRLVCQGTVDERILERAQEKRTIQHMVISGGNFKTDALKPKEVFSLLLDDQEMARMVSQRGQQEKVSLGGRRGKKRGRKSNREKELERVKRVKELENLAESAANNSTVRHGMTSRMLTSSRYDVTSSCQSSEASPSSSRIIESNPPSPTSDISRSGEKKYAEDETLVVVDEANPLFPPVTAATPPMRGRRGRGRPRIRPIVSTRSQDSTSVRRPRGRSSGGRRRGRGVFTGRVAAMAGARAGAAAASAAAMAVYGYNYPTQK